MKSWTRLDWTEKKTTLDWVLLNMENMSQFQARDENKQAFTTQLHSLSSVLSPNPHIPAADREGPKALLRDSLRKQQAGASCSCMGAMVFPPGSPRKEHALAYSPDRSGSVGPSPPRRPEPATLLKPSVRSAPEAISNPRWAHDCCLGEPAPQPPTAFAAGKTGLNAKQMLFSGETSGGGGERTKLKPPRDYYTRPEHSMTCST